MKKFTKILVSMLCAAFMAVPVFCAACNQTDVPGGNDSDNSGNKGEVIDYVGNLSLDFASSTKKQEVTVKLYVDGDTTHFDPVGNSTVTPDADPSDFDGTQGYIKARYLAINTPESTGKIEEWGKTASNFTHDKLANAKSIIVESDDSKWNVDSTGSRYLLWVWYLPEGATEYRNLNVEILQSGLALGSSVANNRYGSVATAALNQAKEQQLYMFSGEKDPLFDYNVASVLTLKELRLNVEDYEQKKVKVEGRVIAEFSNSVYIEDYDPETGVYFGMTVYYGFQTGSILEVLSIGNLVSVVGSVTEFQGTYQISGVSHDKYAPDASTNSTIISKGTINDIDFAETEANLIVQGTLQIPVETLNDDGEVVESFVELAYGDAIMSTSVSVSGLTVIDIYTTHNGGDSDGAMSMTCKAEDGTTITVRTEVLKDSDGNLLKADQFLNKTINVKGIIEKYNGNFQVKCYRTDHLTIVG